MDLVFFWWGWGVPRIGRERVHCRRSLDPWLFGTLNLLFVWWDKRSHWPPFRKCGIFHARANGLELMESLTLMLLLSCNVRPCSPLPSYMQNPYFSLPLMELVVVGVYERWTCVHLSFPKQQATCQKLFDKTKCDRNKQRGNKFGKVEDYKCKRCAWWMKLAGRWWPWS